MALQIAIDKLKQAAAIDPANADVYINMGINYLRMGGENGGHVDLSLSAKRQCNTRKPFVELCDDGVLFVVVGVLAKSALASTNT